MVNDADEINYTIRYGPGGAATLILNINGGVEEDGQSAEVQREVYSNNM